MAVTENALLNDLLNQVAKSLDIPDDLYEEAVQKYEEVGHWLEEKDGEQGRGEPLVYAQGSFSLGTVTRPISNDGEYDIDLVYERDIRKESTSQKRLKEEAGAHLSSFVEHVEESISEAPNLDEGSRCWTLKYPDQFHMDILPAIPNREGRLASGSLAETKILITDTALREWQHSNPLGYREWFKSRMREQFLKRRAVVATEMATAAAEEVPEYKVKTPLQRAIQILKRHRDFYFTNDAENKPVSIILTTLAARAYSNQDNLVDALFSLVRGMPQHIEQRLENGKVVAWVPNPVNDEENFADRWQDEDYPEREDRFRQWLRKVDEDLALALRGGGIHKVIDVLGTPLGRSVVANAAADLGHSLRAQSESGTLGMSAGTGTIVGGVGRSESVTPVRRHTFYGDDAQDEDS